MARFSFASLRARLLLLVLVAVLPALALTIYSGLEERRLAILNAQKHALNLAQNIAHDQKLIFENAHQILLTLSQSLQGQHLNPTACSTIFANLLDRFPCYACLLAATPNGDLFASAPSIAKPVNFSDRQWFQRVAQTRDFVIGRYLVGRISGKAVVALGYPVFDDSGQLKAVLGVGLDLEWLKQLLAKYNLPEGSTLNVIDHDGIILLRLPYPEKFVGKSLSDLPQGRILKTFLAKGEGVAEATGIDGVPRVYGFTQSGFEPALHVKVGVQKKSSGLMPTGLCFATSPC